MVGGGTVLDLTGVGAIAGVPAIAAGAGMVVHGVATGANTINNINHDPLLNKDASATSSGTKAAETAESSKVAGAGGSKKVEYAGVEITNARGETLGEFDKIEGALLIEEKSAQGINKLHPKTGKPVQTPEQWAKKQIYDKTVVRIENLANAADTRATVSGSKDIPSIDEVKKMNNLEFRIENATPEVKKAVDAEIANLSSKYPGWTFTAKFGE